MGSDIPLDTAPSAAEGEAGTALFSAFFVLGVGLVLTGVLVSELM